ncbi:hypothetical protein [Vulcanisaeta thermophila]|uniref:hypothetical protein n=1 Tax=Vulcanisaeta thermophila TaxID=867917 RepID=UPI000853EF26|nr:hypothetical protein [Vulcanisaeta thermophila]
MTTPCCLDTYHIAILQALLWGLHKSLAGNNGKSTRSLYGVSLKTGFSMATIYRKALELMDMRLIEKADRGNYVITTKGLLLLLLLYLNGDSRVSSDSFKLALSKLKEDWDLGEFNDEEVISFIKVLERAFLKMKVPIHRVCIKSLNDTVLFILSSLENMHDNMIKVLMESLELPMDVVKRAERIIAKAILNQFPSLTLNDGCKVSIIIYSNQPGNAMVRILAMKCRLKGYSLSDDCPVARTLISKLLTRAVIKN